MDEAWIRALVVAALVAAALMVAGLANRRRTSSGAILPVGLVGGPALVVFTRDSCEGCGPVLSRVRSAGLPVRRVRWEEEPDLFEAVRVTAVPTTVVVGSDGQPTGAFGGRLPERAFRRAVAAALTREDPEML